MLLNVTDIVEIPKLLQTLNIVFIVEMGVLIISLTIEATGRDVNTN